MVEEKEEITVITESLTARRAEAGGTPCLVVFYGENIGRRYSLDKHEMILGRSVSAHVQIDQESASRQHAKIGVNGVAVRIDDLSSTNGTWVNDQRIDNCELRDGDLVRIGQTIFKFLSGNNIENKYHEEIYHLTTIDGLTQAYNKRYFVEAMERELNRAQRYNRVISLVLFDIDHFKKINDKYGHLAGDYVLRELGRLIGDNLRREDIFARYGGEEFAIILPEIDRDGAFLVCEKLRQLVEEHRFAFNADAIGVTISLGIHTLEPAVQMLSVADFIAASDHQLYEAKNGGRNRVCS